MGTIELIATVVTIAALVVGLVATIWMWLQQAFGKKRPNAQAIVAGVSVLVFFIGFFAVSS